MLSNNADHFFNTPMRTRVYSGNSGNQMSMPAPRGMSQGATPTVTVPASRGFIPGLSGQDGPSLAGVVADTLKSPLALLGIATVVFFLPVGRPIRRVFGMKS